MPTRRVVFFETIFSMFFIMNFVFADPTDGCELDSNNLFLTTTGDLLYNAAEDIGGFQFTVDGTTVSAASGGDAAAAGFTVTPGGSIVLGFSFTGSTIPAGSGLLLELSADVTGAVILDNIVVAGSNAEELDFVFDKMKR